MQLDLRLSLSERSDTSGHNKIKVTRAEVLAKLKDLGIEYQGPDGDGREWVAIRGDVTPEDFLNIIARVGNLSQR